MFRNRDLFHLKVLKEHERTEMRNSVIEHFSAEWVIFITPAAGSSTIYACNLVDQSVVCECS